MLSIYLSLVSTEAERDFVVKAYNVLNRRLLGYAYQLSRDVQWAQDATQHVFLELITNLQRYNEMPDDELAAYCFTIVRNHFYRWSKQRLKHGNLELLDADAQVSGSEVEDAVVRQLEREDVKRALMMVSETHRMVIMLKHSFGRTHSEIARELGISESRSQNLLAEAMREIRKTLGVVKSHG